jgi:hypothetical protein
LSELVVDFVENASILNAGFKAHVGMIGIKNPRSSDIGREFGGDARQLERGSTQSRSDNNDSSCS